MSSTPSPLAGVTSARVAHRLEQPGGEHLEAVGAELGVPRLGTSRHSTPRVMTDTADPLQPLEPPTRAVGSVPDSFPWAAMLRPHISGHGGGRICDAPTRRDRDRSPVASA